ncbi:MAG: hypothetical protein U5K38_08905 [Woeseiaceae bacterium]|nr:hypothetical protein [Woeseiaceae bacterium]
MTSNPANAFFYLLTGAARPAPAGRHSGSGRGSMVRVWSGASAESVRLSVELCTVYWHYLLLVWIVLFGLLLST